MIKLHVPDMTCSNCAATITKAVKGVDPDALCEVDLGAKYVHIDSAMMPSDFVEALEDVGYMAALVGAPA
jgi:copper chaperone